MLLREHAAVAPVTLRPARVRRRCRPTLADHVRRPRAVLPRSRAPPRRLPATPRLTPFPGRFAYPLPPHRLSPSDRACETIFGKGTVLQVPTTRPSRSVGHAARSAAAPTSASSAPSTRKARPSTPCTRRSGRRSSCARTCWSRRCMRVPGACRRSPRSIPQGQSHRIHARQFVVACNGVDSCLLLQRSPDVPQLPSLGRYFMDHPIIQVAIYDSGVDARPGYGDSAQTGMFLPLLRAGLATTCRSRCSARSAAGRCRSARARSCATSSCARSSLRR